MRRHSERTAQSPAVRTEHARCQNHLSGMFGHLIVISAVTGPFGRVVKPIVIVGVGRQTGISRVL